MDPNNSNARPAFRSPTANNDNRLDFLDLGLSSIPYTGLTPPLPPPLPTYTVIPQPQSEEANPRPRQVRRRSSRNSATDPEKSDVIPTPFPWATDRRAVILPIKEIISRDITHIGGEIQCRKCDHIAEIQFNLEAKFREVSLFLIQNMETLRHRAPPHWTFPKLPGCGSCLNDDSMKPIISLKKRSINWLFLFVGQMLGCCTLEQLKYFCKHTRNHRTGAKNRVLFLTYLGICKQLDPSGPFDI